MAEWLRHGRWWGREQANVCDLVPVIAGGTNAFAVTQRAYRFYEDGTETGATAIAAESTNLTRHINNVRPGAVLVLRIGLQESGSGSIAGATTDDYQLQVSKNGGAYASITASSSNVRGYPSNQLTDAAVTTQRLTSGTGAFVAGEISLVGLVTDRQLTADNFTEMLYALQIVHVDVADADTLDFRTLLNGATMTYSVTPRITVKELAGLPNNYQAVSAVSAGVLAFSERIR